MSDPRRARAAFSLSEVMVGAAILATILLAVLAAFSTGLQSAERASEIQLATVLVARNVDRLLAAGFTKLKDLAAKEPDKEVDIDLEKLGEPGDVSAHDPGALIVDGFIYRGRATIEEVRSGMLRLRVTLDWQRFGVGHVPQPGTLTVVRYVTDPLFALQH